MNGRRAHDDGFAMIAVIGAIALITAVAVGGYFLSVNVLGETGRVEAETRAFQVAQSALDREIAVFNPANIETAYFPREGDVEDGSYTVTVEPVGAGGYEYLMTATGASEDSTESVTMRFYYMSLWEMNIGAGDSASIQGGRGWNGQGTIEGPLYTRGDVNLEANSHYEIGPMFIYDGDLVINDRAAGMGEEGDVDVFVTGDIINGDYKDIHLGNVYSSTPDIILPWIDGDYLDDKWDLAQLESTDNKMGDSNVERDIENLECTDGDPDTYTTMMARVKAPGASDYYKIVGDSTRDAVGAGTHSLTVGATSFGAWDDGTGTRYPAGSQLHDDFAFDASTGTLYVEGTVFIDGPLTLNSNVTKYVGNGTLVVNGKVTILGFLAPASGGIATDQALGIATPCDVDIGPRAGGGNGSFTGAIFANGEVGLYGSASATHGSWYEGSILCGNIYGDMPNMLLRTDPTGVLKDVLPQSLPAAGGGMVFEGTWTRQ